MNTETFSRPAPDRARRQMRAWRSGTRALAFALGLAAAAGVAEAQPANSPIPGQGPGYHDPRSAFKPIEEREGVVPWRRLSMVTTKVVNNRVVPTFPDPVKALDGTTVKLEGFMLPLEPGERQRHFLLSAVPTTCSFCVPAGPEGLVEVRTKTPVRYTVEAITVEGRMAVLTDDPYGLFYRILDAVEASAR
jgi:hypothetical protein